jgi:hypothetical protein
MDTTTAATRPTSVDAASTTTTAAAAAAAKSGRRESKGLYGGSGEVERLEKYVARSEMSYWDD